MMMTACSTYKKPLEFQSEHYRSYCIDPNQIRYELGQKLKLLKCDPHNPKKIRSVQIRTIKTFKKSDFKLVTSKMAHMPTLIHISMCYLHHQQPKNIFVRWLCTKTDKICCTADILPIYATRVWIKQWAENNLYLRRSP